MAVPTNTQAVRVQGRCTVRLDRPCRRKLIKKKYGIDVDWICDRDDVKDHHKIAFYISVEAEADEEVVRAIAIEKYVQEIANEVDDLISKIGAAVGA